jgi:hypothetical protein
LANSSDESRPQDRCTFVHSQESHTRIEEERAQVLKIRVAGLAVSLDDFSAGVEQSLSDPLGRAWNRDLSVVLSYADRLLNARARGRIRR